MAKNPKPFAVVTDYRSLIDAFRRRKDELSIPHLSLDKIAGLPSGYSGKLFGRANVRALGPISFGLILNALGLRMILELDERASAKYADKATKSKIRIAHAVRTALIGKETIDRLLPAIARAMQTRGRKAYMRRLTPAERCQIARNAARKRWARAKGRTAQARPSAAPENLATPS